MLIIPDRCLIVLPLPYFLVALIWCCIHALSLLCSHAHCTVDPLKWYGISFLNWIRAAWDNIVITRILICLETVKTGPSITDAAMGRVSQITKVIAEGGYDKIFHQTFDVLPDEKLKKPYACYLSTSAGPVMGVLYLSNKKLAFCSDNPLAYKVGDKDEWSYYKVFWLPVCVFHHILRSYRVCFTIQPLVIISVTNFSWSKISYHNVLCRKQSSELVYVLSFYFSSWN